MQNFSQNNVLGLFRDSAHEVNVSGGSKDAIQQILTEVGNNKHVAQFPLFLYKYHCPKVRSRQTQTVVLVVGRPRSGKSAVCEKVAKDLGYFNISIETLIRESKNRGVSASAAFLERSTPLRVPELVRLFCDAMKTRPQMKNFVCGSDFLGFGRLGAVVSSSDLVEWCACMAEEHIPVRMIIHLNNSENFLRARLRAEVHLMENASTGPDSAPMVDAETLEKRMHEYKGLLPVYDRLRAFGNFREVYLHMGKPKAITCAHTHSKIPQSKVICIHPTHLLAHSFVHSPTVSDSHFLKYSLAHLIALR